MEIKLANVGYLAKATVVNLKLGGLSLTKKLEEGAVQTDSDDDRIGANKKLMRCPEVTAITSAQTQLRNWIRKRTVPSPIREGMLLVPNSIVPEVDAMLVKAEAELEGKLTEDFLRVYDAVIEADREALKSNFNRADYKTPEEIRARLRNEWSYLQFDVPTGLPSGMLEREQEKARAKLAETTDTIQQVLRSEMAKLVNHAVKALTEKKSDGKAKTFQRTTIDNIKEFLTLFRDRNITDDQELDALVAKAQSILEGVDPADLRTKEPIRDSVTKGFSTIKDELDKMMVAAGSRRIVFDEEEENGD